MNKIILFIGIVVFLVLVFTITQILQNYTANHRGRFALCWQEMKENISYGIPMLIH